MRVAHLSLRDFRNYVGAELPLQAGANLLVGRNGQGKTNLAEAIGYFSSLRSHRVSNDGPLVRFGESSAFLKLRVESNGRSALLDLQINRDGANRAQVNGNAVPPREVTRWFAAVAFVPEDLSIVRGEPSLRRRFLDEALISRHPAAAGVLQDYDRVVRQRTALLKSARGRAQHIQSTLSVWDDQLVSLGTQIMLARREYVADSAPHLVESYAALVGEDHRPNCSMIETALGNVSRETRATGSVAEELKRDDVSRETLENKFRETLKTVRGRELERGMTLVGPHRDDLAMSLNGLPVKGFASHGESWSFALGLKLALAQVLREHSSAGDPVMILDDVFAELDGGRRRRLMASVSSFEQVIVTAAVESDLPAETTWHRVRVISGTLSIDEETTDGADTSNALGGGETVAASGDTVGALDSIVIDPSTDEAGSHGDIQAVDTPHVPNDTEARDVPSSSDGHVSRETGDKEIADGGHR